MRAALPGAADALDPDRLQPRTPPASAGGRPREGPDGPAPTQSRQGPSGLAPTQSRQRRSRTDGSARKQQRGSVTGVLPQARRLPGRADRDLLPAVAPADAPRSGSFGQDKTPRLLAPAGSAACLLAARHSGQTPGPGARAWLRENLYVQ